MLFRRSLRVLAATQLLLALAIFPDCGSDDDLFADPAGKAGAAGAAGHDAGVGGSTNGGSSGQGGAAGEAGGAAGGSSGAAGVGGGTGGAPDGGAGNAGAGGGPPCNYGPNADHDGDGWTPNEGDCNDCDAGMNPGAIDLLHAADGGAPTWGDEDCDGVKGSAYTSGCDSNVALDTSNAQDAARAVELCQMAEANPTNKKDRKWGVIDAKWVLPDGVDPTTQGITMSTYHLGHGMLSAFGPNVNVRAGARMLGLSSGTARQPSDVGYQNVSGYGKNYVSGSPAGFPKESPSCPGVVTGQPNDGVAVELQIRTPTNATGFTFDHMTFTYEWPAYVCSQFNDFFLALLAPIPAGQTDGNICFDAQGNPIGVNAAYLSVCGCTNGPPCTAGGKSYDCSLGTSGLVGTGFGADNGGTNHAATGWLNTRAPAQGGQVITLRWTVYDSGDGVLDTSTLIDNWRWVTEPGGTAVVTVPTAHSE